MASALGTICVRGIATKDVNPSYLQVECYLPADHVTPIATKKAQLVWSESLAAWAMKEPLFFDGLTIGQQYDFSVQVYPADGGNPSAREWQSETAGDLTAPSPTYGSAVFASIPRGFSLALNPSSPASDTRWYEIIVKTVNVTPASTDKASLPPSPTGNFNYTIPASQSPGTVWVWARATDTSGNQQTWVALGSFTVTLAGVVLVTTLDITLGAGRMGGTSAATRNDGPINIVNTFTGHPTWAGAVNFPGGVNQEQVYARWEGYLKPTVGGVYTVGVNSDDGANIFIGGQAVITNLPTGQGSNATSLVYTQSNTITLEAGTYYPIIVEYQNGTGPGGIQLLWTPPGGSAQLIPSANLSNVNTSVSGSLPGTWWNGTSVVWFPTPNVVDWSKVQGTNRPADNADVTAGKSLTVLVDRQLDNISDSLNRYAGAQSASTGDGFQILTNPDFVNGSSSYNAYGPNSFFATESDAAAPNSSGIRLKITGNSFGGSDTRLGGFSRAIPVDGGAFALNTYHRGSVIIWRVRAWIPSGYTIAIAHNAYGDSPAATTNLTSMAGASDWKDYVWKQQIGYTGTFSTIGHWAIDRGIVGDSPATWYIAVCSAVCITSPTGVAIRELDGNARAIVDFSQSHFNKVIDQLADGSYSKVLAGRVSGGKPWIDFSEAIHSNKNLDNIPNGTRAAWDSTTQKGNAVDSNGNLKLKNVQGASSATSAATGSAFVYATVSDLTFNITTQGNKVLINFAVTYTSSLARAEVRFAIFRDGVQISGEWRNAIANAADFTTTGGSLVDVPSAGNHTYEVKWASWGGATFSTGGGGRSLQVVELG